MAQLSFQTLHSGEASDEFGRVTCLVSLLLLDDSVISGSLEFVRALPLILRKRLRPLLVEESLTVSPSVIRISCCFVGLSLARWQAISRNSAERSGALAVLPPWLFQISGSSLLSHAKSRRSDSSREKLFRVYFLFLLGLESIISIDESKAANRSSVPGSKQHTFQSSLLR